MSDTADDQGHRRAHRPKYQEPEPHKRPWANKQWNAMTEGDKHMLREHLQTFSTTEDQMTYLKYLRDWCDVPHDWLGIEPRIR